MKFKLLTIGFLMSLFPDPNAMASIPEHWLKLLKTLVDTNSSSDHPEGLEKVRSVLIPELRRLGFQTHIADLPGGSKGQQKLLWADFPGEKPRLLLMGHLDTVFPKTSSFQTFEIERDRMTGPGVVDMKGGIVLMLHVLSQLKTQGVSLRQVRVILNDDEEIGSIYSRTLYPELTKGISQALIFEPGLPDGAFVASHSGVKWIQLKVKGKAAHAGIEHEKGLNACVELANKILKVSRLTDYSKGLTVNVGVIEGGIKPNVVCEEARAKIDIRYRAKADLDAALNEIERIVRESDTKNELLDLKTRSEYSTLGEMESMPASASESLLRLGQSLGKEFSVRGTHVGYGSDGGPLSHLGLGVLVGVGPCGGGMHTREEFMTFQSYEERFRFNTALIRKILE